MGTGRAIAFTTGGTVIYNTATAVYADANNTMIAQGPVCKQAASTTGPADADKTGAVPKLGNDRAKPSAGSQTQGKPAARTPQKGKLVVSC